MKKSVLLGTALLLQAVGFAQLQNTNFEIWENPVNDSPGGNRPVGWIRTNGIPSSENFNFYHDPATPAQFGDYALRLSIWYTYDEDMARQIAPIDYRPAALLGFYTYTDNQILDNMSENIIDDVAKATVRLTKADPATGEPILIGLGVVPLAPTQSYAPFVCAIDYLSGEIPDTIEVIFDASVMDKVTGVNVTAPPGMGVSSILTIDNISLTTETLQAEDFTLANITVYPNPATDIVHIKGFEGNARIYEVSGKLVATYFTQVGDIDISLLIKGVYILSLHTDTGTFNTKLIKL